MLKKLFLLLIFVAPISLVAQEKIAYMSYQEILLKMPELKDIESKLATKRESIQTNEAAIKSEFNKKVEEYQALTDDSSPSVRSDLEKQIQQIQERYEAFIQTSQTELQKEQETLVAPLHDKLQKTIKTVGDELGYTYIIDRSALLYVGANAIDVSKQIKTKLGITD